MDSVDTFRTMVTQFNQRPQPTTLPEYRTAWEVLEQVLDAGDRALAYLATAPSREDERVTLLFQYQQLLKVQTSLKTGKEALEAAEVTHRRQAAQSEGTLAKLTKLFTGK